MSRFPIILKTSPKFGWSKVVRFPSERFFLRQNSTSAVGFIDYEKERQSFKLDVPEYYNFSTDVIDSWAEKEKKNVCGRNGNPAFWWINESDGELQWTFNQLSANSQRTANVLSRGCDVHRGDRVLVILPRVPEWWLINIACIRLGVILIPGTTQLTPKDIKHRLQTSGSSCIITDYSSAGKVDQIIDDCPKVSSKVLVGGPNEQRKGWHNFEELYSKESDTHKVWVVVGKIDSLFL